MAGRGTFVSIVLSFALILLSVPVCTCLGFAFSKTVALTDDEKDTVNSALQEMVDNVAKEIDPDKEYKAGLLFTKYINLEGKFVVIRLTHWSGDFSVNMGEMSEGRALLEAWKQLLPNMQSYVNKGRLWVAVSDLTDWIDYYVINDAPPSGTLPPNPDRYIYKISPDGTDCTIRPYMLLSHHASLPFNQLRPGDSLQSPDGKYKLTIPPPTAPCVLKLEDENSNIVWQCAGYHPPVPQNNCLLAFRSDGTLELWNSKKRIWNTESACTSQTNCAGDASLVFEDGHVKLYKSLRKNLTVYWST